MELELVGVMSKAFVVVVDVDRREPSKLGDLGQSQALRFAGGI